MLKPEDLRAFVSRPRGLIEDSKRRHWSHTAQLTNGASTVEMGRLLFEHARRVQPSFPDAAYLRADLEHHVHLKQLIDRAAYRFINR